MTLPRHPSLSADCRRSIFSVPVHQIKEVRVGKNTDILRNKDIAGHYPDECAFSIIYGDEFETMDLIANTPDEMNIWVTGLTCLLSGRLNKYGYVGVLLSDLDLLLSDREGDTADLEPKIAELDPARWLREEFETADKTNSGLIEESEIVHLVKRLNTGLATVKIQQKLKELSMKKDSEDHRGRLRLTSSEFINLFKEIATRPEIYFLLVRYSSNTDYLTTDDLLLFLEAEQGMTRVTKDKCLDLIEKYEPSSHGRQFGQLGIDGFTAFLLSSECDIFEPEHQEVCQDMSQPLSHYFIASSYNTYLLEDQLKGPSSVEGYIQALKKGCRCVALDCWDGPNEDDPVVYHGHTLTSKISFRSVIETVSEYAFIASDFPVILSIENHCSAKQQHAMVNILKTSFGDMLHTEPVNENIQYLPRLNLLKHKILIKCKKLPADVTAEEGYVTDEDEGIETEKTKKNHKRESIKRRKIIKELSDLVTYCRSTRFRDFQTSTQSSKCTELYSFSESTALKLANGCPEEFVNHNKRFLSRIYPNGMRVDSSNYNPQDLWNCGCQLVTLNYQTPGLMMDLNNGRFIQNGQCGYVLKPAIMRDQIAFFSANTKDVIPGVSPQILHIKVISAQQLPRPRGSGAKGDTIDPYVTVEVFGIPADCAEERTKTVQHNGFNPLFDESFEFQINLPELALVRFNVLDDDFIGDDFIGQYTIPFECMQTGYRHIRLLCNTGDIIKNCTLFVHVAITNKRGGGKASRRGMSVKRQRKQKDYTSMKTTGIKNVDETFKAATQPLRDGLDLRENVQIAMATFQQNCGLGPIANMKQCVRTLVSRIQNSCDNVTLQLSMRSNLPYIEAQGPLPEVLKKAMVSFENVIDECRNLLDNADAVHKKAIENFSWNTRVLKGQADLIRQAKVEAQEYMNQIRETAISLGFQVNDPNGRTSLDNTEQVMDDR
ncbi:hypothetical protein LSH36_231g00005 [Paralvinella palmiformis]|uniref:Phosphoinositide phospholipase C n=1 Tax=Paralvinella palmiformis TaxID=53620 RepID=A0AAD9N6C0_9ANNE|nr:hypothetical protein LSH36_231g00005 [Paralvinella palmiformis]